MKNLKKLTVYLSVFLLMGGLLVGCSGNNTATSSNAPSDSSSNASASADASASTSTDPNQPVDGGNLVIGTFSDIISMNPIFINDVPSQETASFVLANLVDLDRSNNLVVEPWSLASELPTVSADGLTYTVKLKPEAKWSDGQPVTADDVIFTLNTFKNPDVGSPGSSNYDKIDTLTKVDDHTVQIKMKTVYAPFLYSLSTPLIPEHVLKDVPAKQLVSNPYGVDPTQTVTNGPWKWTGWTKGQYLTFQADPNYWGSVKPHIQQLTYKIYADQNTEIEALLKGDADMTSAVPLTLMDTVKGNSNFNMITGDGPNYEYVSFNFKNSNFPDNYSPFQGEKTRQAVAYAIDRQGMVDNVLKGTGKLMNSPFLPGSWADPGSEAVNYTYDPAKAKELLAQDGWVAGSDGILTKDGHKFSFVLQYNSGNSRREQVAAIIQQNLKAVGIDVQPQAIDFSSWIAQNITPGKYEAALQGWALSNPDPNQESIFSSKHFPSVGGQNSGWYNNPTTDALWVKGYSVVDQTQRAAVYKELGKDLSINLPYVFLYQYGAPLAYSTKIHYTDADKPVPSISLGYYYHIIDWWIN